MKIAGSAFLTFAMINSGYAAPIEIVGSFNHPLQMTADQSSPDDDSVTLLKIKLTDHASLNLKKRELMAKAKTLTAPSPKHPARIQLGMNKLPVLNQGSHGSCVTFANTAAVNAALNRGDYISQLCQLQLGRYLETNGYKHSGWDGTWGPLVLNQMTQFGIISKDKQRELGCGGLTEYPIRGADPETEMLLEEYHQLSEELTSVSWSPLLDAEHALLDRVDTTKTLDDVKNTLAAGDRVTFAVLLTDYDLGVVGAVAKHHAMNDTWVLTPQILRDVYLKSEFGGHEMVITGYDDAAIAIDDEGRKHRGLLSLRNSWGTKAGNKGDFYMSYDYFTLLVVEAQRIRSEEQSH